MAISLRHLLLVFPRLVLQLADFTRLHLNQRLLREAHVFTSLESLAKFFAGFLRFVVFVAEILHL